MNGWRRQGLSLLELVVALAILASLTALLLAAVQKVRATARRAACGNNLRQLGLAFHAYDTAHGRLPPARPQDRFLLSSHDPNTLLSLFAQVLPQLSEGSLWAATETACRSESNAYRNPPHIGFATVLPVVVCPADGRLTTTLQRPGAPSPAAFGSYLGVWGGFSGDPRPVFRGGIFGNAPGIRLTDIRDGLSQTLMAGERPPPDDLRAGHWYPSGLILRRQWATGPNDFMSVTPVFISADPDCIGRVGRPPVLRTADPCSRYHFWSLHTGGSNWLFADGAVRFRTDADPEMTVALSSRDGGEVVALPD